MQLKNSVITVEHLYARLITCLRLSVYMCEQNPTSSLGMPKTDQAVLFLEKGKK